MLPDFSFASAPFDGLSASEQALLLGSVEPARFARDAVLLTPESPVGHAWLVVERNALNHAVMSVVTAKQATLQRKEGRGG